MPPTTTPHPKSDFRLDVPETFNFAFDVIDQRAITDRQKLAMIWLDEQGRELRMTYRELSLQSNRMANYLHARGIGKGDHVMLMLPRVPEWWIAVVALIKLGAVACPSAISMRPKDIVYRCQKANIKAVITDLENHNKVDEVRSQIDSVEHFLLTDRSSSREGWDNLMDELRQVSDQLDRQALNPDPAHSDPMLIYFTSGTTGYPKMVMHRNSYAMAHRVTAEVWHDLKDHDLIWTITDTGWAKCAWGALFGQWIAGATLLIYDYRGKFDADRVLNILSDYGVSVFCAPPTAYRLLIQEDLTAYNLRELRRCVSAGEPLNPEVINAWEKGTTNHLKIYEGYGQTETVCLVCTRPDMAVKAGAMGLPTPLFEVDVLGNDLQPVSPGEEGDIAVKVRPEHPLGIFEGYLDGDGQVNRDSFRGDWYLTGDRAHKDEDGYLWFVSRSDDVIKSSGYRIGPFEVESALVEHPAVLEAAVIGVPDELRGQAVKAFVILSGKYEASEELADALKKHVASVTAAYKTPKHIEFATELPKTISGKIRRVELREREAAKS